ncbi:MAG: hypothetical protein EGR50_00590 [Alistipes communis]|nr:hypothetical protein [Alistipes communis]
MSLRCIKLMQRVGRLFYGKFMGNYSLEKPLSALFFTIQKQKSQQSHFCKLLVFRAETEI